MGLQLPKCWVTLRETRGRWGPGSQEGASPPRGAGQCASSPAPQQGQACTRLGGALPPEARMQVSGCGGLLLKGVCNARAPSERGWDTDLTVHQENGLMTRLSHDPRSRDGPAALGQRPPCLLSVTALRPVGCSFFLSKFKQ